ncbi:hypothetical protein VPH35_057974 [Triticum aestivum]
MAFKHQLILWAAVMLAVGGQCVPGQACHTTLSDPRLYTGDMKSRCCNELSAIPAYCRCEALRILMDGVVTPQGVVRQRSYATLVAPQECNLETIHGSPYCPTLQAGYGVVF